MTYLVHAASPGKDDAIAIKVATREEALGIADGWQQDGRSGIRIITEGRIYTLAEFARTTFND